ncbi:MAG: DUF1501 domain-containing protein [Planctomycetota bacterium]
MIRSCAAMACGGIGASMLQLKLTQSLMAQSSSNDYRALVCLYLDGGNDSFNMLVPYETGEYADYESIRGSQGQGGLALERDSLLAINSSSGRQFGLHPSIPELQQLYQEGDLAFVANVGSLIEPTDFSDYQNDNQLPLGLFSHADLKRHWQTSMPQSRAAVTGWGGRVADILTDPSQYGDSIAMSLAVDNVNTFQTARNANPYIISANGAVEHHAHSSNWGPDLIFREAFDQVLARPDADLLRQTYVNKTRKSIDAAAQYNESTGSISFATAFPGSYTGRSFERIAKTIAAAETLGHRQQVFFLQHGPWDHHGGLIDPHRGTLTEISQALGAFQQAMREIGRDQQVLTFTASDFGRTLAGNGQGSDHGWGGNQIVMGGGIRGGDVYGEYPLSLASGNPLDVGRGRLIPTLSVDEFAAELVMWMGISNNEDLETVLPNIRNFYGSGASTPPVGFAI